MGERDDVLDIGAQRGRLAQQVGELLLFQRTGDRAHAIGSLGVAGAGIVVDEAGVRDQERGHAGT